MYGGEPIYKDLSYTLNGLFFKVHNELGRFCNEKQHGDKLELYLEQEKIKFEREQVLPASFEGEHTARNKVDFNIEDKIILELKSKRVLDREDYYQVKRYLAACNKKLGILVNFREKYLKPRRILNSLAQE